ncbi:MAG: class I SAM-dependent methyltransferase [Opitutaceae bacterium]|nr:class I SAM-dependent methyltransferase [Opitutaceae bacterium]
MPELTDISRQVARMPTREEFDEDGYLQLYADIAAGVAQGNILSGWSHFVASGFAEGRRWIYGHDALKGVSREIAPGDEMCKGDLEHYFGAGVSALRAVEAALIASGRPRETISRILDLPCGHGRVMRFLRRAFPHAELVACDLNRDGVDFCAKTFGAVPEYSETEVDRIPHQGVVDLVWCGSLLTHLSEVKCRDFMRFFTRVVGHRGILVFTMHGRFCAREFAQRANRHELTDAQVATLLHDYQSGGFGYVPYEATPEYGFSLASPAFVIDQLMDCSTWKLLHYHEAGWDRRQDVIALQKWVGGNAVGL